MKLINLLDGVKLKNKEDVKFDIEVKDIKIDHRLIEDGDVYIALKGEKHNGNDFIEEAIKRGASCVITDTDLKGSKIVNVENARSAYALMSKNYFGKVCDQLRIIAITGTNGKTTTANTICEVLNNAGYKSGVIGTLGAKIGDRVFETGLTTPDPYMLHSIFVEMKKYGAEFVIMEASAHALALNKLDGIKFEIGLITNITEDHLDFFGNMENYADAKIKLFDRDRISLGIYSADMEFKDRLIGKSNVKLLSYGLEAKSDYKGKLIKSSFEGSRFEFNDYKGNNFLVSTPLVGRFNVENALATIAVCKNLNITDYNIIKGLENLKPVEGRFNVVKVGNLNIVVDFAHTPDGLEKVLETAGQVSEGKLVAIFGCGGNRDKLKRPIMGRIASQLADEIILTSDNPRFENPSEIISQIKEGVKGECKVIVNRKEAIEFALSHYHDSETIVIAGKGAEKYQEIEGVKYPYSDFSVIDEYIGRKKESLIEGYNKNIEI